jgi:uncharacterized membrane protein HdeD (DUF308 family)
LHAHIGDINVLLEQEKEMHLHASLIAITLTVAGVMILLFAFNPRVFSVVVVLGVVLVVDGLFLAGGGFASSPDPSLRRYYFLWGVLMLIAGGTLVLTTSYSIFTLTPYVLGSLLLLLGLIALWGAASR